MQIVNKNDKKHEIVPKKESHVKGSKKSFLLKALSVFLAVFLGVATASAVWYQSSLGPVNKNDTSLVKVSIAKNSTSSEIANQLKKSGLIRSKQVFYIYTHLNGKASSLQAGIYQLSPSYTIPKIVDMLSGGSASELKITFYPGATLVDNTSSDNSKYAVTTVLKKAGYSDDAIKTALAKTYDSPLFDGKPTGTDLEGYIYGDTYSFGAGVSVEEILQATFDEFYSVVKENDLVTKFAKHGLNLYEGITLASIVQRESSNPEDQKHVAQIFYSRLDQGMALGSDVTYQYIADKLGVTRSPSLDSPYNTRLYKGLTPGPISVPGLTALQAVANPASTSYLYFLSGDDGSMHYAYTEDEHNSNIKNYCQVKCSSL